jgi:hypothetical protein
MSISFFIGFTGILYGFRTDPDDATSPPFERGVILAPAADAENGDSSMKSPSSAATLLILSLTPAKAVPAMDSNGW